MPWCLRSPHDSFTHSYILKHVFSIYRVPEAMSGARDTVVSKTRCGPCLYGISSLVVNSVTNSNCDNDYEDTELYTEWSDDSTLRQGQDEIGEAGRTRPCKVSGSH